MGSVLVAIFWIWCGVSVVILITRPFYRRATARSGAVSSPTDSSATPTTPSLTTSIRTTDLDHRSVLSIPAIQGDGPPLGLRDHDGPRDIDGSDDLDDFEPASLFEAPTGKGSLFERPGSGQAPDGGDPTDTNPTDTHPSEPGDMAPTDSASSSPSDEHPAAHGSMPVRTRSIAEILTGIQMPCDLAPLTGLEALENPTHVVFTTEGHPAHRVGVSISDELERIGCTLEPVDATTLRVKRGSDSLDVQIHPDAAQAMDGDEKRFPTASEGAVVVEFRLR